jgi:predicted ATPase
MLLERESPLASLEECAADARRGDGRLVLVAGEAGAGKTSLIEEFERLLPDASWAWGACDGLFTPGPLSPLFDIAEHLGGELRELCHADGNRDRLFGALLASISRTDALRVIVLEDLYWADEATVDLVRLLGRRLRGVPALVLVTYRDQRAAADPLRVVLGSLATQRSTRHIVLTPLSLDAVTELAAGSPADPAELYRQPP